MEELYMGEENIPNRDDLLMCFGRISNSREI